MKQPCKARKHTISNDSIAAVISEKGAELVSLQKNGMEYLWQGDPEIWSGQSPLLFPIIGRLKGGRYTLDGEAFEIPIHGFARHSCFEAVRKTGDSLSLRLTETSDSLEQYPFSFSLTVTWRLEGARLIKEHLVENRSDEVMYFELGGHEGYRLDLFGNDRMEDYELRFPEDDLLYTYTLDENIMINRKTAPVPLSEQALQLSMELFKNDALILENIKNERAELWHRQRGRILSVEFSGFPYLGVWTHYRPGMCRYVCLEPWSSLPDCNFLGTELSEKRGVKLLYPGEADRLEYSISMED